MIVTDIEQKITANIFLSGYAVPGTELNTSCIPLEAQKPYVLDTVLILLFIIDEQAETERG